MSWISENYEKAALGVAAIAALGIGAAILTGGEEDGVTIRNGNKMNEYEVAQKQSLIELKEEVESPQEWKFSQLHGSDLTSFVAFPLYAIKGEPGIKPLNGDSQFDGIPLTWWKENSLDGYQYKNAGAKDADKDGFSNKEEFLAKTDPSDAESHPDLITKLKFIKALKPKPFRIQWSRLDDKRGSFTFKSGNAPSSLDLAGVGDTFPSEPREGAYKNRFKIVEKGRGVNPTNEIEEDFYIVEDQNPLKEKRQYKLWYSGRSVFYDWKAMFQLMTPNGGEAFTIDEGAEFSLPYVEGGKGYKLKLEKRKGKDFGDPNIEMKTEGGSKVVPLGLAPPKGESTETNF